MPALFRKISFGIGAGIVVGIFALVLHLSIYYVKNSGQQQPPLSDSDCYLWLLRSEELHQHFTWYPGVFTRSNPPIGETSHWSRWMDMGLYIPSSILSATIPKLSFRDALFQWGIIISPLLMVGVFALAGWLSEIYLKSKEAVVFALLFLLLQPGVHVACMAGRPDHHSLLLLLFTGMFATLTHALVRGSTRWAMVGGLVGAVSMSVSAESLIQVGVVYAMIFPAYAFRFNGAVRTLRAFIHTLPVASLILYLLARNPGEWGTVTLDQICWLHIVGMLIPCVIIETMARVELRGWWLRATAPLALALALAATFRLFHPEFFSGPYGSVSEEVRRIWLTRVAEVLPLITKNKIRWFEIILVMSPCTAGIFVCWKNIRSTENSEGVRAAWALSLSMMLAYSALTLLQFRWLYYVGVLIVVPWASIYAWYWERYRARFEDRLFLRAPIKVAFLFVWIFLGTAAGLISGAGNEAIKDKEVSALKGRSYSEKQPYAKLFAWIDSVPEWKGERLTASCYINRATEFLYYTHHNTLSTPYHRNQQGILDEYHFQTSISDEEARKLASSRNIGLIVICPTSHEEASYYNDDNSLRTLHERLVHGQHPEWIEPVALPEDLAKDYLVYRVRAGKS